MNHQRIFITGASSGIGEALARAYASKGVTLGLAARRLDRLESLAEDLKGKGATVYTYQLDVTDQAAVQKAAKDFLTKAQCVDLVIANAGIAGWGHPLKDDVANMTNMINVNVNGVINTIAAFVQPMCDEGHGHVVAISSIAGFKGLPGGVYSASKAAVRYLMDGWRDDLKHHGIAVTTIFPGFIESEITRSAGSGKPKKWHPFIIPADEAAKQIMGAIDREARYFITPWQWRFIVPILRLLPPSFFAHLRRARSKDTA